MYKIANTYITTLCKLYITYKGINKKHTNNVLKLDIKKQKSKENK